MQSVTAGSGGGSFGGTPGTAGNSTSTLDLDGSESVSDAAFINAQSTSIGGNGGYGGAFNAADGGTAYSDVQINTASGFSVQAGTDDNGTTDGSGGNITAGTANAGNGGTGTVYIDINSSAATSSGVTAVGTADAGNGGMVTNGALGSGGAGGFAIADGQATNVSSGTVSLTLNVSGGSGGQGGSVERRRYGRGADIGSVDASSTVGAVSITLSAMGGSGGAGLSGASGGVGGFANLNEPITVSTPWEISLGQTATGGNGGASTGGTPGAGRRGHI